MSTVLGILRTTVIKISLFFILLKKKRVYRTFYNTLQPYFVPYFTYVTLGYIHAILCPPRAKPWRRHCFSPSTLYWLAAWRSGYGVRRMNEVNPRRARLVLGWVTVFGRYTISVCNQPTSSTQPCIPPGSLNRVPASVGVRAGMSPLPGGR